MLTGALMQSKGVNSRYRVSLVIPAYRDSLTLARALDSVFRQTRPADEVVLVNDNSPESEAIETILARYPVVRYFRNPVNIGLAATRNRGVELASGDVICFLDADDECHPQRIAMQLSILIDADAVVCDTERVGFDAKPDRFPIVQSPRVFFYRDARRNAFENRLTGASMLIHKATFKELEGFDETLRSCEDLDFWLRLLSQGRTVARIRAPLYRYYYNPFGLSKNLNEIGKWELTVIDKHIRSGRAGNPTGLLAACLQTVWLGKQYLRSARSADRALNKWVDSQLFRLGPWPVLKKAVWLANWARLFHLAAFFLKR